MYRVLGTGNAVMASSSLTCVKEGNICINSSIAIVRPFSCENHGADAVGVMEDQDGISPSWRGVEWEPRGNMTVQIARLNLNRWLTEDLGDWSRYTFRTNYVTHHWTTMVHNYVDT